MYEREMRQVQEDRLYEIYFAQEMLDAGKLKTYRSYIGMMGEKAKNGMTADEIDAVKERVKKAVKEQQE
jgi:hypothetical protein